MSRFNISFEHEFGSAASAASALAAAFPDATSVQIQQSGHRLIEIEPTLPIFADEDGSTWTNPSAKRIQGW